MIFTDGVVLLTTLQLWMNVSQLASRTTLALLLTGTRATLGNHVGFKHQP